MWPVIDLAAFLSTQPQSLFLDHNNQLCSLFNHVRASKKRCLRCACKSSNGVSGSVVSFRFCGWAAHLILQGRLHLMTVAQVLTLSCRAELISSSCWRTWMYSRRRGSALYNALLGPALTAHHQKYVLNCLACSCNPDIWALFHPSSPYLVPLYSTSPELLLRASQHGSGADAARVSCTEPLLFVTTLWQSLMLISFSNDNRTPSWLLHRQVQSTTAKSKNCWRARMFVVPLFTHGSKEICWVSSANTSAFYFGARSCIWVETTLCGSLSLVCSLGMSCQGYQRDNHVFWLASPGI